MHKRCLVVSSALLLSSVAAFPVTVHTPLIAMAGGGGAPSWFTETRIVNLSNLPATVHITDVVGVGNPTRTEFLVPARGVADLQVCGSPETSLGNEIVTAPCTPFMFASVEFDSDQPIRVLTTVNTYSLTTEDCGVSIGPFPAHFGGGCTAVGGPILSDFRDYLPADQPVRLDWLTADRSWYRTNLYVTNPNADAMTVSFMFRSDDGTVEIEKTYSVPPRALKVIPNVFSDSSFDGTSLGSDGAKIQGAATALVTASKPFYVFASVVNNSDKGKDSTNRFALTQPSAQP